MKKDNYKTGQIGENLAVEFLMAKGHNIIERNFRYSKKEIDIISVFNEYLIFVEVKKRRSLSFGSPAEAVDIRKQKAIIDCANYYLQINDAFDKACRFDVIEVLSIDGVIEINHIENAFWT